MVEAGSPVDPMTAAEARLFGHWVSEATQVEFFETVLQCAHTAEQHCGTVTYQLELAGTRIDLRFAGEQLARSFMPALAHLRVSSVNAAAAVLHVWDSASTGVPMPPPPCKRDCFTDRGDIWGMASPRIRSAFHWSEFSVNLMDLQRNVGVFWVRSDAELPYWTSAAPLRTLFHWCMELSGAQLLHAAAVGTEEGALLITGKGGVGKSSAALACLGGGMQFISDDYLVVRLEPSPTAFCLYSTAKLEYGQLERFPALSGCVAGAATPNGGKAVLRLLPRFSAQLARALPIRAVATPSFGGVPETRFSGIDRDRLARAAAFTTLTQLPHAGRRLHEVVQQLVTNLPGREMHLGSALERIPEAIQRLLRKSPSELEHGTGNGGRPVQLSSTPLVSVIIPVYNGARFLAEAVANILEQEYRPLEIIVIDDGSTDDLPAAIADLPVEVRYFRQENNGPASARNRGIREASGDLLAFLDVDDLWPLGNLQALRRLLAAEPELDALHGRAQVTLLGPSGGIGEYYGNPAESFKAYIGAGLYRRRAFERVGLFDQELRYGEDVDWFNRADECHLRIGRLDEVTLFVRRHEGNMTRGKTVVELNLLRVMKKHFDRRAAGPG